MLRTEYMIVTDFLKKALKEQKLTYRDFSQGLGLSESGLKKMLSARDGSFQRLAQMCKFLGLSLSEALAGSVESMREIQYTQKQQEFLTKDPRAFHLFWLLVYERVSVAKALQALDLNETKAFSILRKLDELRLLKLLPGNRVQVPPLQLIRWAGQGPLIEKIYREWSENMIQRVASPSPPPGAFFMIRYFKMKPKTLADLNEALHELENEFSRRGTQDMRTGADDLVHLRWIIATDNQSFLQL